MPRATAFRSHFFASEPTARAAATERATAKTTAGDATKASTGRTAATAAHKYYRPYATSGGSVVIIGGWFLVFLLGMATNLAYPYNVHHALTSYLVEVSSLLAQRVPALAPRAISALGRQKGPNENTQAEKKKDNCAPPYFLTAIVLGFRHQRLVALDVAAHRTHRPAYGLVPRAFFQEWHHDLSLDARAYRVGKRAFKALAREYTVTAVLRGKDDDEPGVLALQSDAILLREVHPKRVRVVALQVLHHNDNALHACAVFQLAQSSVDIRRSGWGNNGIGITKVLQTIMKMHHRQRLGSPPLSAPTQGKAEQDK